MDNKTDLRIKAKSIRKTLDIAHLSKIAITKIRNIELYKSAKNVLIFYPMKYEINLLSLQEDVKNFYLPKVCGDDILVCPYSDEIVKSEFNVCEPCTNPVNSKIIDVAIVPALMVDKFGYRLGYGGGFYDRFLTQNPCIKTICPIPKELYTDYLPHDDFDIPVNHIVVIEKEAR